MTGSRRRRIVRVILGVAAPVALLAGLRPWTIRPLDDSRPAVFQADTFVASAWPRLASEASQTATDVADVLTPAGASTAKARFVKGTGVVSGVDRRSRVGVMLVRVTGSGAATVALQIGPVVRGTALRDASGFIHFSDFTNQFDYASAANALNDHALRTVVGPLSIDALEGRTVTFTGAIGKAARREDGSIEIVPVRVDVAGAP